MFTLKIKDKFVVYIIKTNKIMNYPLIKDTMQGLKMASKTSEELYKTALGENIRKIRKRVKMTQDAFSEKIGIEPSSLSNIENGKSFPSTLTVIQIQKQFNVRAEEIFDIEFCTDIRTIEEDVSNRFHTLDNAKKRALWLIIKSFES